MISVAGISKSFGNKKVLDEVSFTVEDGEIFGLLGPSGAGKTTLIRVLTGQLRFEEGEAMVMGKRVSQLSGSDKKQFGVMMDDFGLYERLTCYQNLRVFADIYGVDDAAIHSVLSEVKLQDAQKKEVSKLSKGMKERLRLARALLSRPKVLFLDEPTSGLDPQTSSEIHEIIRKRKDAGTIIFLTTHNMTEAEKLCDHLVLLNEGHIVESGSPKELCLRYDHQKRIEVEKNDGEVLSLEVDEGNVETTAGRIAEILRCGELRTIHSKEPNLETVFMELTGRELEV
ncbi:MAG: ABC transporter ATP-binding protein [Clostridiales bacterium]|nr:ABC transporter ATP-binding protein [Clostridiales bacterium]